MTARMPAHPSLRVASVAIVTLALATASAQTKITAPKNKYKVQDDIKVGQEAAAEAKKELPMLNDDRVDQYVEGVGARLVMAIPPEFQHPEFKFTFDVVNEKDINAFALPGGPMFLNRGMMEASKSEAEMAGVMAHEISHVALRHGTAQASKSTLPSILGAVGQIGGAILGGTGGDLLGLGSQIGAGAWMTNTAASTSPRLTSSVPRSSLGPATTPARWPTCSRPSRRRGAGAASNGSAATRILGTGTARSRRRRSP
jgi:predicted Zn-dependent protease